jgi:hypothetical protein
MCNLCARSMLVYWPVCLGDTDLFSVCICCANSTCSHCGAIGFLIWRNINHFVNFECTLWAVAVCVAVSRPRCSFVGVRLESSDSSSPLTFMSSLAAGSVTLRRHGLFPFDSGQRFFSLTARNRLMLPFPLSRHACRKISVSVRKRTLPFADISSFLFLQVTLCP